MSTSGYSIVTATVNSAAIDRASKLLAGIPNGFEKALRSAASRTASAVRTESTKAIRERYDITAENIRAKKNVSVKVTSSSAGTVATVKFKGTKIPLYRYNGTSPVNPTVDTSKTTYVYINGVKKPVHPSVAASAHQLKGTAPKKFQGAFVAEMKSGHIGIFERTGGVTANGNDEIKEIQGSSVPQMLGNKQVQENVVKTAVSTFDKRLDHEITRILNGWGK